MSTPVQARQEWDAISVRTTHVRGSVYAIFGTGANQAISVGGDQLLVVDAGYAELGDRLLEAIRALPASGAGAAPFYLVNTHWHFDHTGANAVFAEAGATIVAHEATAPLMATDQSMPALGGLEVPAAPPDARPALVFSTSMGIPRGTDVVEVAHAPSAHSAGDAVVYFRDADVVHVGDLFFNGMYPFIDVDHGGTLKGLVSALEGVLSCTGPSTLYIPGHGPLADRADLEDYTATLRTVHRRISSMIERGLTRAEVIASKPTADLDARWRRGGGFNDPDAWVGLAYDGYAPLSTTRDSS
jgi:glyoxylase-like metal-dependent hydrolase (beta-lactamase superfamily II)